MTEVKPKWPEEKMVCINCENEIGHTIRITSFNDCLSQCEAVRDSITEEQIKDIITENASSFFQVSGGNDILSETPVLKTAAAIVKHIRERMS